MTGRPTGATLGQQIRDARVAAGLSLRALARQLEVAPSYMNDIENDRRVPSEFVLIRIAASQRLNPVGPEDGEHSKTAAEAGEGSDQSNLGDSWLIAGAIGACLRVLSARESVLCILDLTCVLQ